MAFFDNATRARALEASEVHRIFSLVDDEGYDPGCRHGGPEGGEELEDFCRAAFRCSAACMEATKAVYLEVRRGQDDEDLVHLASAELDVLFQFWSPDAERRLIGPESSAVCFSCAVDALFATESDNARFFVRLGAFCELVHALGVDRLKADIASGAADAKRRVAPLLDALRETHNDRGVALVLQRRIPCACLSALTDPRRCRNCMKPCPVGVAKRTCARCKQATYCDRDCQAADWVRHRIACKPHAEWTPPADSE